MHVCVCFCSFAVAAYKEGHVHWREERRAVVGSNGSACLLYLCCTLALSQSHCKVGLQLLNSVCQRSLRSPTEPGWAAGGGDWSILPQSPVRTASNESGVTKLVSEPVLACTGNALKQLWTELQLLTRIETTHGFTLWQPPFAGVCLN